MDCKKYRINEIFYSIQGEGRFAGTAAIFIRFAGCNLRCDFCDTKHQEYNLYTLEDIMREIALYKAKYIVLTGGEPTLQIDIDLLLALRREHYFVQIETNGTMELSLDMHHLIDWTTLSPKDAKVNIRAFNELKVVYQNQDMDKYEEIENLSKTTEYYLQPCDLKDEQVNTDIIAKTIEYIKEHPQWKLSLQTQKILNVR